MRRLCAFARRHPSLFLTLASGAVGATVIVLYAALWLGRMPPMDGFASGMLVILALGIGVLSSVAVLFALFPVVPAALSGVSRWEPTWSSKGAAAALAFSGPLVWWAMLIGASAWRHGVQEIGEALRSPEGPSSESGVALSLAGVAVVTFLLGRLFSLRSLRRCFWWLASVALLLLLLVLLFVKQLAEMTSGSARFFLLSSMFPLAGAPAMSVIASQMLHMSVDGRVISLAFRRPDGKRPWKSRWSGFHGALLGAIVAGFWAWMLAVVLLRRGVPYWVFGAYWATILFFIWLYHERRDRFVAYVSVTSAVAGFAGLLWCAQPIGLLGMGRFYASCALEERELRLVRMEVARSIAGQRLRTPSGDGKSPEDLAKDWVRSLACADVGDGRWGCVVYVWWAVGGTWLVSSPRDGVANATERPDWKGPGPWAPLLVELRDGATKCTRATGHGQLSLIRTIP